MVFFYLFLLETMNNIFIDRFLLTLLNSYTALCVQQNKYQQPNSIL